VTFEKTSKRCGYRFSKNLKAIAMAENEKLLSRTPRATSPDILLDNPALCPFLDFEFCFLVFFPLNYYFYFQMKKALCVCVCSPNKVKINRNIEILYWQKKGKGFSIKISLFLTAWFKIILFFGYLGCNIDLLDKVFLIIFETILARETHRNTSFTS